MTDPPLCRWCAEHSASPAPDLAGYCPCCYRGMRRYLREMGMTWWQGLIRDRRIKRRVEWRKPK